MAYKSNLQHAKEVVSAGVGGYRRGQALGNMAVSGVHAVDRHMDAANMRAIHGNPTSHDRLVHRYTSGRQAENMRRYFDRTMPKDAGGPRTAAFYAYRYRQPGMAPNSESAGTPARRDLLGQIRRQQAMIHATRNAPRVGMYRDADPSTPYVNRAFQR